MESQVVCACREAATSGLPGQYGESRTKDPSFDGDPAWSSDGIRIAFASHRDGNWEVYVMNADGSAATNISNRPTRDESPAWSPDGSRVAFVSDRDGNAEIYIMNVDGSGPIHLTNNPAIDLAPAWSSGPTP
jgi:Tol biopolymer transport system component